MSLKDIFTSKDFIKSCKGRPHNFQPENEYLLYMHRCEHETVTIDSFMYFQNIFKLVEKFPTTGLDLHPYYLGLISITAYIQYCDPGYSLMGWYGVNDINKKFIFCSVKGFEPDRFDLWKWELVDFKEHGIIAWPEIKR